MYSVCHFEKGLLFLSAAPIIMGLEDILSRNHMAICEKIPVFLLGGIILLLFIGRLVKKDADRKAKCQEIDQYATEIPPPIS